MALASALAADEPLMSQIAHTDSVNHPSHYTQHPSGVECITIVEEFSFNLGNAVKYIWRAGLKNDDSLTDLHKARWYLNREIRRLESSDGSDVH